MTDRIAILNTMSLCSGSHESLNEGACVMEAVAYVAGEPWSDHPTCACPVITSFMIAWNDSLPTDADRDRLLKPLVPQIIETRSTAAVEERRSYMALDWLIRVHTPKWLDLVPALASHAKALRDLEEIVDMAGAAAAGKLTDAAWAAAWAAAWDAAWDAAGDAAGYAARAWAAARAAARAAAAVVVARAAAGAVARAAAAAGAAAGDFLKPTTEWLQTSALDLVARMIACSESTSEG